MKLLFKRVRERLCFKVKTSSAVPERLDDHGPVNVRMNGNPVAPNGPKILVVEDNLVIQITISQTLTNKGYRVFKAEKVTPALGIIRQEKPDLILLDLSFPLDSANIGGPEQDGSFLIDWLKQMSGIKKTPIIIISGTHPENYKGNSSLENVITWFHKPLNHEKLLAAIEKALCGNNLTISSQTK